MEYKTIRAENSAMFEKKLNTLAKEDSGWRLVSSGMSMRTRKERHYDVQIEVWWGILERRTQLSGEVSA